MHRASAISPSQLEIGTKLVGPSGAGWRVALYPEAAEAIAVFHSGGSSGSGWRGPGDPEASHRVATRRARTRARRYCAANRLNRLGTLTYRGAGCHEPRELRQHVGSFFRRLRSELGGERFPYLWTGEWHARGHGLHAHFAAGRYIRRGAIERCWPHGFVHIKLLGDLPAGSTSLAEARMAARYLAKYVGKAAHEVGRGLHRYEVAQHFAPRRVGVTGRSSEEVLAWAADQMGRAADLVKPSAEWDDYEGPPAVFASWI